MCILHHTPLCKLHIMFEQLQQSIPNQYSSIFKRVVQTVGRLLLVKWEVSKKNLNFEKSHFTVTERVQLLSIGQVALHGIPPLRLLANGTHLLLFPCWDVDTSQKKNVLNWWLLSKNPPLIVFLSWMGCVNCTSSWLTCVAACVFVWLTLVCTCWRFHKISYDRSRLLHTWWGLLCLHNEVMYQSLAN